MVELPISYLCGSIYSTQQQKQKQGHHWDTVFPSVQKLPSNLHPIRVCVTASHNKQAKKALVRFFRFPRFFAQEAKVSDQALDLFYFFFCFSLETIPSDFFFLRLGWIR